ncbi:MAG: hypothetical protein Q4D38_14545 [Planctomycetia bacterium]|nr:hypothetical protein [Planctomycetia bacterium]
MSDDFGFNDDFSSFDVNGEGEFFNLDGMQDGTDFSTPDSGTEDISFGASVGELEYASILHSIGDALPLPFAEKICDTLADALSGAGQPGMEVIHDCVRDSAEFFNVEQPNVFHEPGQPGVQWGGFSDSNFDNWIGGDPEVLQRYTEKYGEDFVSCTFAHETGHHVIDRIGWDDLISRRGNEAASDYMAGLYAGSKNLDPEGFAEFLREEGNVDHSTDYPLGEEREALFRQGYEEARFYPFRNFQSILDDVGFNLHGRIQDIQKQYG